MKRLLCIKFILLAACFTFLTSTFFESFVPQTTYAAQKSVQKKTLKKVLKSAKKKIVKKSAQKKKKISPLQKQKPFFEVIFAPIPLVPTQIPLPPQQPTEQPVNKQENIILTLPPVPHNSLSEKATPKKELFIPEPFTFKTSWQQSSFLTTEGILFETNKARTHNGNLPSLTLNQQLSKAAELKIDDMFQKQYFEHVSPTGQGPADIIKQAEYQYILIGENLALGDFQNDSDLVTGWMNSPGHRANILHTRFQEIGIAVKKGIYKGSETWLAVQEFGKPLSACPSPNIFTKQSIELQKQELQKLRDSLELKKNDMINAKNNPLTTMESYQILVDDYNSVVAVYNEKVGLTKKNITDYNNQVAGFNTCIDQ